jgi:DNA modification methylase
MIICGDSTTHKFPKKIKLLLTDPPYGMDINFNHKRKGAKHAKLAGDSNLAMACNLLDITLSNMVSSFADDCLAIIFCNRKTETHFEAIAAKYFRYTHKCTWVKTASVGQSAELKPSHGMGNLCLPSPSSESFIFANRNGKRLKYRINDVIFGRVNGYKSNIVSSNHVTPKPFDMLKDLIESLTDFGDLVADPFAGSGNTLWAARLSGRKGYGVELQESYCNDYKQWIATHERSLWDASDFMDCKQSSLI